MCRNYIYFVTFISLFLGSSLLAQEGKSIDQQSEVSLPAEQNPLTPNTGKPITLLTIEQIRVNLPTAPADRFEFLRRQRKITLEAITETSSQFTALTARLDLLQSRKKDLEDQPPSLSPASFPKERIQNDLERAKADLAEAENKLATMKAKPGVSQQIIEQLQLNVRGKQEFLSNVQNALDTYDQRRKDEEKKKQDTEGAIKAAMEDLSRVSDQRAQTAQSQLSYQRLLGEIDDMVNQLFIASDATNSFKLRMSIAFSVLVGVVIVGFFVIAWSNDDIKRTIFSNESGIQFITMFAIVIAVILFGIIGVLESKELSALLGGLSGYILGKSKA